MHAVVASSQEGHCQCLRLEQLAIAAKEGGGKFAEMARGIPAAGRY